MLSKHKDWIIYGGAIIIVVVLFLFLLSVNIIGYSVKEKCQLAQDRYEGDCVEALIAFLDDGANSYRSRNSAIWALGQLGDSRALPTLRSYYTGYEGGPVTRLTEGLSQYELKKAIALAEGGLNITVFFWRFGWVAR